MHTILGSSVRIYRNRCTTLGVLITCTLIITLIAPAICQDFFDFKEHAIEVDQEYLKQSEKYLKHFIQASASKFLAIVSRTKTTKSPYLVIFGSRRCIHCLEMKKYLVQAHEASRTSSDQQREILVYYSVPAGGDAVTNQIDIRYTPTLIKIVGDRYCTFRGEANIEEVEEFYSSKYMGGEECGAFEFEYPSLSSRLFTGLKLFVSDSLLALKQSSDTNPYLTFGMLGLTIFTIGVFFVSLREFILLGRVPKENPRKKLVLRLIRVPPESSGFSDVHSSQAGKQSSPKKEK